MKNFASSILVFAALAGCSSAERVVSVKPAVASGQWNLDSWDGTPLPIDHGLIPGPGDLNTTCHLMQNLGALSMTSVGFELSLASHSSCRLEGPPLDSTYEAGWYVQAGESVTLHESFGVSFDGVVHGDTLLLRYGGADLRFHRAPALLGVGT